MTARAIFLTVLLIAGIDKCLAQPKLEVSEYIKTLGGGAITDTKKDPGKLYVGLNLEWVKRPPVEAFLVVEFANAGVKGEPAVVEQAVDIQKPTFFLKSPNYSCVVNNSTYIATISLYADKSKTILLGVHRQQIGFSLPPKYMEALKLKECDA